MSKNNLNSLPQDVNIARSEIHLLEKSSYLSPGTPILTVIWSMDFCSATITNEPFACPNLAGSSEYMQLINHRHGVTYVMDQTGHSSPKIFAKNFNHSCLPHSNINIVYTVCLNSVVILAAEARRADQRFYFSSDAKYFSFVFLLLSDSERRYLIPRETPSAGRKIQGGGKILRFSTEIAVYLGNGTR